MPKKRYYAVRVSGEHLRRLGPAAQHRARISPDPDAAPFVFTALPVHFLELPESLEQNPFLHVWTTTAKPDRVIEPETGQPIPTPARRRRPKAAEDG